MPSWGSPAPGRAIALDGSVLLRSSPAPAARSIRQLSNAFFKEFSGSGQRRLPRAEGTKILNGGRKMPRAKQTMDGNTAAAHVAYAYTDVAAI